MKQLLVITAKFNAAVISSVFLLGILSPTLAQAFTGNGTGAIDDPYKVSTCEQLQDVSSDLDGYYIQTGNIDCSATETWNSGAGFVAVGSYESPFAGVYDGQGFTINNLHIDAGDEVVGLFGYTGSATIRNVNLRGGQISSTSGSDSASLIGVATDSTITNCSSTVTTVGVRMSGLIGTLIGPDASIDRSWYVGSVTSGYNNSGYGYTSSLIGTADNLATITNVYSGGTFSYDGPYNGALIGGFFDGATITNAYSTVDVTMRNSYGGAYAGGLFGLGGSFVVGTVTATNIFFAGTFDDGGALYSGAIVGLQADLDLNNVYYDSTKCGCTEVGSYDSGTQDITDEADSNYFKGNSTNAPMSSWDFDTVWQINEGDYPSFIPSATAQDSDTDNVSNTIEDSGPNSGDANGDGIADSAQSNVASLVNDATSKTVALEVNQDSGCQIYDIDSQTSGEQATQDIAYSYPLGLLSFHLSCTEAGATATITQYYFDPGHAASNYTARKLINSAYSTIPGATISDATVGGRSVVKLTYQITDGGALDSDGTVNQIIVDPSALGISTINTPNTGLINLPHYLRSLKTL